MNTKMSLTRALGSSIVLIVPSFQGAVIKQPMPDILESN